MSVPFAARSVISAAYLLALVATGQLFWRPVLIAVAVAAVWAMPLLRRRWAPRTVPATGR